MAEYVLILTSHKQVGRLDVVRVGSRYHKPRIVRGIVRGEPTSRPTCRSYNAFADVAIARSLAEQAGLKACKKCWKEG